MFSTLKLTWNALKLLLGWALWAILEGASALGQLPVNFLWQSDYNYPAWEDLCTGLCNSSCLTSYQFLVAVLEEKRVIETVSVAALSDTADFRLLLSNTTRFKPSPFTWTSCSHIKGKAVGSNLKIIISNPAINVDQSIGLQSMNVDA